MKARTFLPLLLLWGVAAAAPAYNGSAWWQILVPKAFSPNPLLEISVFTDLTPEGRKVQEPAPGQPVYYVAQNQGYRPMGEVVAGDHPPVGAEIEHFLHQALAARGYLPADDPSRPPGLVLVYFWGVHYNMDPALAGLFPDRRDQYLMERAALVGGRRYAYEFSLMLEFGVTLADRSPYKDYLRNQTASDLYYVVVSAYDFAAIARDEHKLLWRTTLTVTSQGLSMKESLPPLILTGGEYFGRKTPETVAIRRNVRRGTVTLGPLRIIESDVSLPPRAEEDIPDPPPFVTRPKSRR
jgi:hypothetical protein